MGAKLDRTLLQGKPLTTKTPPAKYVADLLGALAGRFKINTIVELFLKSHASVADIRAHMVAQILAASYEDITTAAQAEAALVKSLKATRATVTRQRGVTKTKG